uniref:HMG box domain-containing protein n=1 Tax=Panagrolaimus superbus TaxID=310955 RepID=A0A914Y8X3_9BILA
MNYKDYFIFEPGKAKCLQENCPKKLVYRKQGNTSGMRSHLKKYHPHIFEQISRESIHNDLGSPSSSTLIQNLDTLMYNFNHSNSINYETIEVGSSSSNNFYEYSNDDAEISNHNDTHEDQTNLRNYDVKAEFMDILFNESNNVVDSETNNFRAATTCVNSSIDPAFLETQPKINAETNLGYILFSAETRTKSLTENPDFGFGEISRMVGIEWNKLSDSQKYEYESRAQEIAKEKAAHNIHRSHFDEQEIEAIIPHKRSRNDLPSTALIAIFFRIKLFDFYVFYQFANPIDNISYLPPSEEPLPSPSAPQYGYHNATKRSRCQFSEADKAEIKNRIKRKELLLIPVTGSIDIMNFVVDDGERIAVFCTVCGGLLSAKGGGSITYHRNACSKFADPTRTESHPFSAEIKKNLNQKCFNLMTKNYFPSVYFHDKEFLDILQYVHNLGFNFGAESIRTAKDDVNYGPGVMSEAMPYLTNMQRTIDQTIFQNSEKLKEFINFNIKNSGGALSVERIDKYCQYFGFTFHLITKDFKLVSVSVALKEYTVPPTSDKINEDIVSLLNEYNLSVTDITILLNGEIESNNCENYTKNASHFLKLVLQWVLNPEDEKFQIGLNFNSIEIMENFVKLVDTVKDVLEYAKTKPNLFVKVEVPQNEIYRIFFIKQFLEMSAKNYETITFHLKNDQQSKLLQQFYLVKQRYQDFKILMNFLNPFLAEIESLDVCGKPTLYMVPLIYESLMKNFNKFRDSKDKLIAAFSEAAYLYLEYVKQKLICDSHYIALFLNPKLNGQIESLIKQEELDKLLDKITVECSKIIVEKSDNYEPVPKKFSNLRKRQKAETTFQTELDEYLAVEISENDANFELLDWWKQNSTRFPRLSQIAKKYHSIPASFVSKNGAFDVLNILSQGERIATTPEMLSKMVIYRSIIDCCF